MFSPIKVLPITERLLTVIWVGSLWTVGFMVVPLLFSVLEDRQVAGMVAGRLFSAESYLGLVCGGLLLLIQFLAPRTPHFRWKIGLLGIMLTVIIIGEFGLQPIMADLKAQGLSQGVDFGRLHAVSTGVYLVNCLLGLILIIASR